MGEFGVGDSLWHVGWVPPSSPALSCCSGPWLPLMSGRDSVLPLRVLGGTESCCDVSAWSLPSLPPFVPRSASHLCLTSSLCLHLFICQGC